MKQFGLTNISLNLYLKQDKQFIKHLTEKSLSPNIEEKDIILRHCLKIKIPLINRNKCYPFYMAFFVDANPNPEEYIFYSCF